MYVRLVAVVLVDGAAEEGGKVLVHDDGLEGGDDPPPRRLEDVLVRPVGVHLPYTLSLQYQFIYVFSSSEIQILYVDTDHSRYILVGQ